MSKDPIRVGAVLWTWLEQFPLTIGELRRKPPEIRAQALKLEPFERLQPSDRARLEAAPIPIAAELLVRVDRRLTLEPPIGAHLAQGVDGGEVLVMWKGSTLAMLIRDDREPPLAAEQPSLAKLAPRLSVCPVMYDQIELKVLPLHGESWKAACDLLELGAAERTLSIHLDALGEAGLDSADGEPVPGWRNDEEMAVGWFDEDVLDQVHEDACTRAATDAVQAVAGLQALLVMPELTATSKTERAIVAKLEQLCEQGTSPALTVVGLYHRPTNGAPCTPAEMALLGGAELATRFNEAVVLGPTGEELWRHRKLSCAQALAELGTPPASDDPTTTEAKPAPVEDTKPAPVEDIRLGRTLELAESPIGWIAVVICIDAFAKHVRPRLERSGADVLLVPSLSPSVHRHRNSLQLLVQTLWGTAFVCNRSPTRPNGGGSRWNAPENRSFWAIERFPPIYPETIEGTATVFDIGNPAGRRPEAQA